MVLVFSAFLVLFKLPLNYKMDRNKKIALLVVSTVVAVVAATTKNVRTKSRRSRRMWVREIFLRRKQQGYFDNLIRELRLSSPELFFNFTRMTATTFEKLLSVCGPHLEKHSNREPIKPEIRLLITLRHIATGDSYPTLSYAFRVATSTICNIISETCQVIWNVLVPTVLSLPTSTAWLTIAQDFYNLWQLPNCIGSIDGKHVHIKAPTHSGSLYFNYKKYYCIVLLAVCDAKYFFTHVNIGAYGAQSDGGILRNSPFGQNLREGTLNIPNGLELPLNGEKVPLYFVGDEAFPLQINLLRPYSKRGKGRMPEEELVFNYRLSRARRTIENTLGVMTARFRIFHRVINAEPTTVVNIIKATTYLHNFIRHHQTDANLYCSKNYVDREVESVIIPGQWRQDVPENTALGHSVLRFGNRAYSKEAFNFRDYMKTYLNGLGSVPWQIDHVQRTS